MTTYHIYSLYISVVILALVGFYLILSPRLKQSPYRLVGVTCLLESIQFYDRIGAYKVCNNITTFLLKNDSKETLYDPVFNFHTTILDNHKIGGYISQISFFGATMLNLCIFYDLKHTIYNPFYVREKRNKYYAILCILSIISSICYRIYWENLLDFY